MSEYEIILRGWGLLVRQEMVWSHRIGRKTMEDTDDEEPLFAPKDNDQKALIRKVSGRAFRVDEIFISRGLFRPEEII